MSTRRTRRTSLFLAGLLAAAAAGPLAANAAAGDPFSPVISMARGNDAARAASSLRIEANQHDGQQQVGSLKLRLPGASATDGSHGFALTSDVPGTNDAQIGTLAASFYVNPRPSTLDITGTIHDDNASCPVGSLNQCVLARVSIPGIGDVELKLEIPVDPTTGDYVIEADLTDFWNEPYIRGLDARLRRLVIDLPASVNAPTAPGGKHVLFRNPAVAGSFDFAYELTSAAIADLDHAGGAAPACGVLCTVPLPAKEYAPSRPGPVTPANGASTTTKTNVNLRWSAANDVNGDAVTYAVLLDGPTPMSFTVAAPTTSISIGTNVLAPGAYSWTVTATESSPVNLTNGFGAPATFKVLDAATAATFKSGTDALLLFPAEDIAVLQVGNATIAGELSFSHPVNEDRGTLSFENAALKLHGAYDIPAKAAALALVPATGNPRTFTDLPG